MRSRATEAGRYTPSLFTQSLMRVSNALRRVQKSEVTAVEDFERWQLRWTARRDQIARRLTLIDSQLQELVDCRNQPPQLMLHAPQLQLADPFDSF